MESHGGGALSSGEDKSVGGNSAFEQTLNAQPFFVAGTWDRVDGGAAAKGISAYLPKGATADDQKQAAEHGIAPIDLVVVNLYPFETTAAKAGLTAEELIEKIKLQENDHLALIRTLYKAKIQSLRSLIQSLEQKKGH